MVTVTMETVHPPSQTPDELLISPRSPVVVVVVVVVLAQILCGLGKTHFGLD